MLDLFFAAMRRLITSGADCGSWLVDLDGVYSCAKLRHKGPLLGNSMYQKVFEVAKNVFELFSASTVLVLTMFPTGFFSINNISCSKWFSRVQDEYLDSLGVKYLIFTWHISSLFSPRWFPFCNFCPSQPFHFVPAHCQRNSIEASSWGSSVINSGENRSGWENALEQKGFPWDLLLNKSSSKLVARSAAALNYVLGKMTFERVLVAIMRNLLRNRHTQIVFPRGNLYLGNSKALCFVHDKSKRTGWVPYKHCSNAEFHLEHDHSWFRSYNYFSLCFAVSGSEDDDDGHFWQTPLTPLQQSGFRLLLLWTLSLVPPDAWVVPEGKTIIQPGTVMAAKTCSTNHEQPVSCLWHVVSKYHRITK